MARSRLVDLAFGYMPAQIVFAAAELGIADALTNGPRSSEELAKETGTHAPSLHRMLRALTCFGMLEQREPDLFALTEDGERLKDGGPTSQRQLVRLFCSPSVWESWGDLTETIRTGESAWDRIIGKSPFEHMAENPDEAVTFNAAMSDHTREIAPAFTQAYDFARFGVIADLGGGDGTLLAALLKAAPAQRGVLFDLDKGLAESAGILEAAGVADRCDVVAGDFFESVPGGIDAYVLKSVIHDWDDEKSLAILRSVRKAAGPDSRLLLLETLVPEMVTPATPGPVMSDMNMLVCTGGRERTAKEFREMLAAAGFTLTGITEAPPTNYSVVEAAPAP
ncbi:helix-turn-helix domain-containing protein [Actinomadura barringtoniae]|uniref:Helix-turn-helix domain-containing protein n=1 Tax=Actinomadura barringtoniae TaxID=1427535 RepID=A0A939PUK7_9ACTN|nr:methyltransferase [Actinomadura barringtoniae]MBO2455056.1 helix-turn-helix domain-containing protein [Actinomadura barringtoniae]